MAAEMRKAWGVSVDQRRTRTRQVDQEAVRSLMEICGPDLTERGAKKLLRDQRGDTTAALNFFMDMPPHQRARLNAASSGSDDEGGSHPEIGPINATLPRGWHSFRTEIVAWVKAQCAGLGVSVNLAHAETTQLPHILPAQRVQTDFAHLRALLESAQGAHNVGLQCLEEAAEVEDDVDGKLWLPRSFSEDEDIGKARTVDVHLRKGFVDAMLQREKKFEESSQTYKSVESKLISLKNMTGSIDWRSQWLRGTGPTETPVDKTSRGAVTVQVNGSSDSYIIPACMLSFPKTAESHHACSARFSATNHISRDPVAPLAVETACSKVMIFDRVGNTVSPTWLSAITDTLQNRFLDTQIFYKRTREGYRFAVCGLGAYWVRYWLLGRLLYQIPAGHSGLRGDAVDEMEQKTGCAILLTPQPCAPREKAVKAAVWEWKGGPNWTAYPPDQIAIIEEAHAAGLTGADISLNSNAYRIEFSDMMQVNTDSHTRRPVRRVVPSQPTRSPQPMPPAEGVQSDDPLQMFVDGELGRDAAWHLSRLAGQEIEAMWGSEILGGNIGGGALRMRESAEEDDDDDDDDDDDGEGDGDGDDAWAEAMQREAPIPPTLDAPQGQAEAAEAEAEAEGGDAEEESEEEDEEEDEEDDELAMALAMSMAEAEAAAPAGGAGGGDAGADAPPPPPSADAAAAPQHVDPQPQEEPEPEPQPTDRVEEEAPEPAPAPTPATPSKDVVEDSSKAARSPEPPVSPPDVEKTPPSAAEGHMWVAVVGPHNTRSIALSLIEREREVREVMLRVLPSMQGCISPEEVMVRTQCKVVAHEGPGMVRLVGYPADIEKARAGLVKLMPMWQQAVQTRRLAQVTKDLVRELSKIEVRVPISDRMRQLLSQPIGMHASSHLRSQKGQSLLDKYRMGRRTDRRTDQPDVGKVQVMWVSLDEFAMDITKRMSDHGVPVPKEWTPQGASIGLYIGDTVRSSASFSTTPAALKAVDSCNAPVTEDGHVLKVDSWLNLDPETQRTTLDVFLRTVEDWLKCTCEQRVSDPGRPSLVTIEVEWEVPPRKEVRGHHGMWRQDGLTINNYWCSSPLHRDWPFCEHVGDIRLPHWSCCGERNLKARCTKAVRPKGIQLGSRVVVKESVKEPKFKWGQVKHGDVGTVVKIDRDQKDKCMIEFPQCKKWKGYIPDLELAPLDKQKGVLHNPSLGCLRRVADKEQYDNIASVSSAHDIIARVSMKLVQQKWCMLADQYLLAELGRVLSSVAPKDEVGTDLRAAHATTQRARHRLKEMEKDAEKISSQLIDSLYQVKRGLMKLQKQQAGLAEDDKDRKDTDSLLELLESLIELSRENLREWLQAVSAADFEAERQLLRLREAISKKEQFDRRRRTVWDIIQHISDVSGAFVDYRPPNLHLRVSGNEVNIRAAMQHLRFLGDEGAQGLEKSVTVSVAPDVAARLRRNSCVMLQLIEQQAGLHDATLGDDNILELVGTEEQVLNAISFLDIRDQIQSDEYSMPLLSQAAQDWGRQQSAIPASDPKTCSACLSAEDEPLYELLCGHNVHPGCLRMWVSSCIERSKGITESGEMEGPGAVAVCPMTGGGGCTHVLTTREFCEAARVSDGKGGGAHNTLDNLDKHIRKRLPTHDKIRSCPKCSEWVIVGPKAEPLQCKACSHIFCAVRGMPRCGGVAHYFSSCDQFAKAKVETMKRRGQSVTAEVEAVGQMPENCVPCRRCQSWIMREEDLGQRCRYMVCRECMYEFCWLCLMPAVNHKHVHTADTPQEDRAKAPECDPDHRDKRRIELMNKMQEGEVVSVWRDCSSCSRCDKWPIPAGEKAYGCLQCPNVYLCEGCESQGCTIDASHVLDDLPRFDVSAAVPPAPLQEREEIDVDESFWNDILPRDGTWECRECLETCTGDVCPLCGERRLRVSSKVLCPGGHDMEMSASTSGGYKDGWVCTLCGDSGRGERWLCAPCQADYCYACTPRSTAPSLSCPGGHTLRNQSGLATKGVCSGPGCAVVFPTAEHARWRCEACDYDVCAPCYKGKAPVTNPRKHFINLFGLRTL